MTWKLFPSDTDQPTVEVWHLGDVVGIDVGDMTAQLTVHEARHLAGALGDAARRAERPAGAA